MYKGVSKEQRDKVQLMASEKKIRAELEDSRQQLKKLQVIKIIKILKQITKKDLLIFSQIFIMHVFYNAKHFYNAKEFL